MREADIDCAADVGNLIDALESAALDVVIFQTGVGARALFREADKLGRLDALLSALQGITTVCRGPKPTAALRQAGVQISASVAAPYTTRELLDALAAIPVFGKRVMALQYGERNAALIDALRRQAASVNDLCLYEWQLPDDPTPLRSLVDDLLSGNLDAIAFTSQVQIRHLYQIAADRGIPSQTLSAALNARAIVAAVGPHLRRRPGRARRRRGQRPRPPQDGAYGSGAGGVRGGEAGGLAQRPRLTSRLSPQLICPCHLRLEAIFALQPVNSLSSRNPRNVTYSM